MDKKYSCERRLEEELDKLGIVYDYVYVLQDKDGVCVARIFHDGKSSILKCFQKDEYKREIENYQLLASLNIPTIQVIAFSDSALLLEDIDCSRFYRLGMKKDMDDIEVARKIARWYRQLHEEGYGYISLHGALLYDESDLFTLENIARIKEKTKTQEAAAWKLLERSFSAIHDLLWKMKRTLTYNDFYYTNMIVAKDNSSAFMFDYNLLGKGYAYADIRNVLSSLSKEAGKAFLAEYGVIDPIEKAVDDVVSVVVTLHLACQRTVFPHWGRASLDEIDTTFMTKIEDLRQLIGL